MGTEIVPVKRYELPMNVRRLVKADPKCERLIKRYYADIYKPLSLSYPIGSIEFSDFWPHIKFAFSANHSIDEYGPMLVGRRRWYGNWVFRQFTFPEYRAMAEQLWGDDWNFMAYYVDPMGMKRYVRYTTTGFVPQRHAYLMVRLLLEQADPVKWRFTR